jgi:Holliday junction resolvasome RuvABC endonuclease subunit
VNILALDLADHTGWARRDTPIGYPIKVTSGVRRHSVPADAPRDLCFRQGLRLSRFRDWLRGIVGGVGGVPWFVAYEAPIMFKGRPAGVISAYQFEGVLLAELASLAIPHRSVATGTLKKHATGSGAAKKPAMIAAAESRWAGETAGRKGELGDDEADALCVLAWALDELGER